MASNTANYGLRKPGATDVINVDADINNNLDTIDTQLKSNQDVAAEALSVANDSNIIQAQATDIALPADTWVTVINRLQNQDPLPVGPVIFDIWFAVSAPVAPSNLLFYENSLVARNWILQAWAQGNSSVTASQGFTGKTLVLPVAPLATQTLYQVRGYASEIDPSSYVKLEIMAQGQPATLHNFVCLSTVNDLGEL